MERVIHCVLLRRNASFDDETMRKIRSLLSERGAFRYLNTVTNVITERPISNVSYDSRTGELSADLHMRDSDIGGLRLWHELEHDPANR